MSCTRIYFHNINGIPAQDAAKWSHLPQHTHHSHTAIIGLAETKLRLTVERRHQLIQTLKRWYPQHDLLHSHSTVPTTMEYLPGGVCSIITGTWCGRITRRYTDSMGRWTAHTLVGKQGRQLIFIFGYRVVQQDATTAAPPTAAREQWQMLQQQGRHSETPRTAFLQDLETVHQGENGQP